MAVVDPLLDRYRSEAAVDAAASVIPSRVVGAGAIPVGALIAVVGIWAALVPYAGPAFAYSVDGSAAWHWNLAHALLGLVPGVVAAAAGVLVASGSSLTRLGLARTRSVLLAAVVGTCAAWLAIGPLAWPVLYGVGYYRPATSMAALADRVGSGIGPGLLLMVLAGMAAVLAAHAGAVLPVGRLARPPVERRPAVPLRLVVAGEPAPVAAPAGALDGVGTPGAGAASVSPFRGSEPAAGARAASEPRPSRERDELPAQPAAEPMSAPVTEPGRELGTEPATEPTPVATTTEPTPVATSSVSPSGAAPAAEPGL